MHETITKHDSDLAIYKWKTKKLFPIINIYGKEMILLQKCIANLVALHQTICPSTEEKQRNFFQLLI